MIKNKENVMDRFPQ